jgi:hypothetical protein
MENLEGLNERKKVVLEASKRDPTDMPPIEGQQNIIEQGNKEIDYIFQMIFEQLSKC